MLLLVYGELLIAETSSWTTLRGLLHKDGGDGYSFEWSLIRKPTSLGIIYLSYEVEGIPS